MPSAHRSLPNSRTERPSRVTMLIATLALLLTAAPTFQGNTVLAQDSTVVRPPAGAWWIDLDMGDIEAGRSLLALGVRGSWMPSDNELLSLRAIYGEEFRICVFGGCPPPDHITDIGVLYGRVLKGRWGYGAISAGLGWTGGKTEASNGTEEKFSTVGLPILGEIYFTPFSFLGIGASGFGNLNVEHPFAGIALSLQIGDLGNR